MSSTLLKVAIATAVINTTALGIVISNMTSSRKLTPHKLHSTDIIYPVRVISGQITTDKDTLYLVDDKNNVYNLIDNCSKDAETNAKCNSLKHYFNSTNQALFACVSGKPDTFEQVDLLAPTQKNDIPFCPYILSLKQLNDFKVYSRS